MVTANVDITALKARHPLGDTVEAAGVRLRGRGRVRQGVCPFPDENEGSFTVYADSERFYCFGCGLGGDVLDFIQWSEGLSLPEAIARLDGSPGLAPRAANRPAGPRQPPEAAALPPRDPNLLTAAARFYAGQLRRQPGGARAYLVSRGVGPVAAAPCVWASAMRRAAGCGRHWNPRASMRRSVSGTPGCSPTRGAERFAGMVVVPDVSGGLVRWLVGPGHRPRPGAPVPGAARSPSRCLGLGRIGRAPPCGRSSPRASSTGSPLRRLGLPRLSPPWAPRAWSGWPPPCGAAPASSSPSTADDAGREATERLADPARSQGRRRRPPRRASATWPSLRPFPTDGAAFLRLLAHRRPAPPASGFFPASHSPHHFPSSGAWPAPPCLRDSLALHAVPTLTAQEDLCPMHDGLCPPTASHKGNPPIGHSLQDTTPLTRRRHEMFNKNGNNGHGQRDGQRASSTVNGNGHKPDAAIVSEHELLWGGLSPAVSQGARTAPRPGAGLPAQGPRRAQLRLPRRPRRHRARPTASSDTAVGATSWLA